MVVVHCKTKKRTYVNRLHDLGDARFANASIGRLLYMCRRESVAQWKAEKTSPVGV
jgi:hypothetical protein